MSYIYQNITLPRFRDAFQATGRQKQFSYDGLELIYNRLMQIADDSDVPQELDVIELCCDFAECESIAEYNAEYGEEAECWSDVKACIGETSSGGGVIDTSM